MQLPKSIKKVIQFLADQINPDLIVLFGSRARGTNRETSDFDLAVYAKEIPSAVWNLVQLAIKEDPITLYSIDLVHFEKMDATYQKNISDEGIVLYEKNKRKP